MSLPAAWPQVLDFFGTPLVIEASSGQLSGDAGLLPVRQFDQRLGLTRSFADALDDPRDPDLPEHTFLEMVHSGSTASSPATRIRTTTTPPRRPHLQARGRSLAGGQRPGQPAHPLPLRECHLHQVPQAPA